MVLLKIALCACFLLLVEASESSDSPRKPPIHVKTFHASYFDRIHEVSDVEENAEGGAVVLKSNLPAPVQARIASALTAIYQSTTDNLQRAQQFQSTLARIQYYILLQINNDRVLGFGLS